MPILKTRASKALHGIAVMTNAQRKARRLKIVKAATKLRMEGVLPPPGPIIKWGNADIMLRPCTVCNSVELQHTTVTDNSHVGKGAMIGTRFVCGCGHEGPIYPNHNPVAVNKATFHAAVLWNKQDDLSEEDGAYVPNGH